MKSFLLPYGGSSSPGTPKSESGSRFWSRFDYIKRVTALQASLDYQSQPTTGKSP